MANLTADFELGTDGNTIAAADPGSATQWDVVSIGTSCTATYSNTQKYGTLSAHLTSDGTGASVWFQWEYALEIEHFGRFYIYPTESFASNNLIFSARNGSAQTNFAVAIGAGMVIRLYDGTATIRASSVSGLPLNQWSRIEFRAKEADSPNGEGEARLFLGSNADGLNPDETISFTGQDTLGTGGRSLAVRFGLQSNTLNRNIYLDNLLANATAWPSQPTDVLSMQSHIFGHNMW